LFQGSMAGIAAIAKERLDVGEVVCPVRR